MRIELPNSVLLDAERLGNERDRKACGRHAVGNARADAAVLDAAVVRLDPLHEL